MKRKFQDITDAVCLGILGAALLIWGGLGVSARMHAPRAGAAVQGGFAAAAAAPVDADSVAADERPYAGKVLLIGDSMTGWMGERLNEYGRANGFEVATVVWDGSTIRKWGASPSLRGIIERERPDAIMVCLGMNEMLEQRPGARLAEPAGKLLDDFGDIPYLWIGPPSWPGRSDGKVFSDWISGETGEGRFFDSTAIGIPRQSKSNPHPTRKGIEMWVDSIAEWIPEHARIRLRLDNKPESGKVSRGKTFIYKRMTEKL